MIGKSRDASLGYTSAGNGSPPLVFIHGLTYDSRMWKPVFEILKAKYRCISIDLPGHGSSARWAAYDLESVTHALRGFTEDLGVNQPVIVGHSMGSVFAALYAATYSTVGLITVDQPLFVKPFVQRIQSIRDQLRSPAFLQIWRAIESELGVDLIPQERRSLVTDASRPDRELVLGYWREALELPVEELQQRLTDAFRHITVPFTAVFGNEVAPEYRAWVAELVPQCRILEFPGVGHFPHLVNPGSFAHVVAALARGEALQAS